MSTDIVIVSAARTGVGKFGGSLAKHQGRARGRVDLVAVMGLDDLDVPILVQSGGNLAGQLGAGVFPLGEAAQGTFVEAGGHGES